MAISPLGVAGIDAAAAFGTQNPTLVNFINPLSQLAPFSPFASLAAVNPTAALSSFSPTLQMFNPAINPRAALLAFNPSGAPALAISNPAFLGLDFTGIGGISQAALAASYPGIPEGFVDGALRGYGFGGYGFGGFGYPGYV